MATYVPVDNTEDYLWLVVLGAFASFFAAFGIGANDVANAFATSVGSKALTVKQACALAVVFEFLGATFLGGEVVKTIRKGIADPSEFEDNPPLLMWGCFCVILAVGVWLLVATKLEMPVSTTHSCVGGMIGMALAARGAEYHCSTKGDFEKCQSGAVIWFQETDEFPYVKGFAAVVCSWLLSPVVSGSFACVFFLLIRTFVMRSSNPFQRSLYIYPFLVMSCVTIVTLFMLMKGIKSNDTVKEWNDDDYNEENDNQGMNNMIAISFGTGILVALAGIPAYITCKRRIEDGKFVPPPLAIEVAEASKAESTEEGTKTRATPEDKEMPDAPQTFMDKCKKTLMTSLNTDPHAAVGVDAATTEVHKNAERYDKKAEAFFTYLQIFSAIFDAFAHGANDVANAVGPYATIYVLYQTNEVSKKADMDEDKYWILALGGVGIGFGLLLYGYQILRAIGVKLAVITPSRGFCIEMGSSLVVILGAHYGWPLSTTHCQVGATMGVALLEGQRGFNKWVIGKTVFGWLFTCVFVGFLAAAIFSFGAYAPMANLPPCVLQEE